MSSADALLQENKALDKLYDADCMMDITLTVAQGYVVLLGGVQTDKKQSQDISLAFMALTNGNVLDACFGVPNLSRHPDSPASRAAAEAKQLIDEYSHSESFCSVAVKAYMEAFQAVIEFREQYEGLNCITRCFRTKKLRRKCEIALREAFLNLARAVSEQCRI